MKVTVLIQFDDVYSLNSIEGGEIDGTANEDKYVKGKCDDGCSMDLISVGEFGASENPTTI